MNDKIKSNLKLIFNPMINYFGEWEMLPGLKEISKVDNGKNAFKEFLERYYYSPLNVIFKDDELARSFKYAICSTSRDGARALYFSKRAFLRNVISNIDDVLEGNGDNAYAYIKKAIRSRKDIYRDVVKEGENSPYYKEIMDEYIMSDLDMPFIDYLEICKRKYTKLLSGYNAVLELFDKPIDTDKFMDCFDANQLYLFTTYSLLNYSKKHYEAYGKLDYNIVVIDTYKSMVEEIREKDSFYNSHLLLKDNIVYTIDDLFRDYEALLDVTDAKKIENSNNDVTDKK